MGGLPPISSLGPIISVLRRSFRARAIARQLDLRAAEPRAVSPLGYALSAYASGEPRGLLVARLLLERDDVSLVRLLLTTTNTKY